MNCQRCRRRYDSRNIRYRGSFVLISSSDPLEISAEELDNFQEEEIENLLSQIARLKEQQLNDEVAFNVEFEVCASCAAEIRSKLRSLLRMSGG